MSLIRGIDQLADEAEAAAIDRVALPRLGIEIIAEGVETQAERDALVRLGGDLCQGYLFARPEKPWATSASGGFPALPRTTSRGRAGTSAVATSC